MKINRYLKRCLLLVYPECLKPKLARLIITQNCPLKCQMCSFWHTKSPEPSLELIKYWIQECYEFGIKDISLGGGEPFLRNDLVEIVSEIKKYGMTCGVTTSAWYVHKKPFPDVDRCEISIDGYNPETHDKIRGKQGSWKKCMDLIHYIQKNNLCEIPQINFVLQKDNYKELIDFCIMIDRYGLKVSLIPVSQKLAAQPYLEETFEEYDPKILRPVIQEAMKIGNITTDINFFDSIYSKMDTDKRKIKCLAPYIGLLVFANSDVYPCGNLNVSCGKLEPGTKLSTIYDEYKPMRKEIRTGNHEFCNKECTYPDIILGDIKSNLKLLLKK